MGVIFGVAAATVWVSYGVAQRCYCAVWHHSRYYFCCTLCVRLHYCHLLSPGDFPVKQLATGMPDFCGLNTGRLRALAEAMARWQAAQVSALITLTPLFTLLFSDLLSMAARCFRQTDVKPDWLSRCVCRGCGRDVFRHRSSSLGTLA